MDLNSQMKIINSQTTKEKIFQESEVKFSDMVKAVVDINKKIISIGGELHADEESLLIEQGSNQEDLWGINLYINDDTDDWIEFDSMINIRPNQNNLTRGVDDPKIQMQIKDIISSLILG